MEFGLFYQLPVWPDQTPAERYADTLAQIEHGDRLGFETAWLAELHFMPERSIMPAPLLVAAAAAERTQRIRLGIGVSLLPLHDPVRAAEEAASLDVLSGGRLEYGVGRGMNVAHFDGFGVPMEERTGRFTETLEVILRAWGDGPLNFEGEHFRYTNVNVVPKPLQRPHPPIRIAANSDDSFERAGSGGFAVMASPITATWETLSRRIATYHQLRREHGNPAQEADIALLIPVHVAADGASARTEAEPSLTSYMQSLATTTERAHLERGDDPANLPARVGAYRNTSYAEILEKMAAVGDADEVTAKLRAIRDELGIGNFICWFDPSGRISQDGVLRSMSLFMARVQPRLA